MGRDDTEAVLRIRVADSESEYCGVVFCHIIASSTVYFPCLARIKTFESFGVKTSAHGVDGQKIDRRRVKKLTEVVDVVVLFHISQYRMMSI